MSRAPRMVWMDVTLWLDREGELKLQKDSLPKLHDGSVLWVTRTPAHGLACHDMGHLDPMDRTVANWSTARPLVSRAVDELSAWLAEGGPVDGVAHLVETRRARACSHSGPPSGSRSWRFLRATACLWLHVWSPAVIRELVRSDSPWLIRHWAGSLYQVEVQTASPAREAKPVRPLSGASDAVSQVLCKRTGLRLPACRHPDARQEMHPTAHAQDGSPAPHRARHRPRVRSTGVRSNDTSCPGRTGTAEEL